MGIEDKIIWVIVAGGVLSALVFVLVKVGERIVKRRTAALLEKHGGGDEDGESPPAD